MNYQWLCNPAEGPYSTTTWALVIGTYRSSFNHQCTEFSVQRQHPVIGLFTWMADIRYWLITGKHAFKQGILIKQLVPRAVSWRVCPYPLTYRQIVCSSGRFILIADSKVIEFCQFWPGGGHFRQGSTCHVAVFVFKSTDPSNTVKQTPNTWPKSVLISQ